MGLTTFGDFFRIKYGVTVEIVSNFMLFGVYLHGENYDRK
jgi:hypothetical protein